MLLGVGRSRQVQVADAHTLRATHRLLQFAPPEPPVSQREIRGDEQRPGRAAAGQNRGRDVPIVTVAVVEREHGEGPLRFRPCETLRHGLEAHDLEVEGVEHIEAGLKILGRHLQQSIRREAGCGRRPDMMEREDHAAPPGEAGPGMRLDQVAPVEPGGDDRACQRHSRNPSLGPA